MNRERKWLAPLLMWLLFVAVAVGLWLGKKNLFYLFNFSYIGSAIALGLFLFAFHYPHARRVVQLLVGSYMLVYLGLISRENMQIDIRTFDLRAWLVRLCLLDGYGSGFPAL